MVVIVDAMCALDIPGKEKPPQGNGVWSVSFLGVQLFKPQQFFGRLGVGKVLSPVKKISAAQKYHSFSDTSHHSSTSTTKWWFPSSESTLEKGLPFSGEPAVSFPEGFQWVSFDVFQGTQPTSFTDWLIYQQHDMTSHSDPLFPEWSIFLGIWREIQVCEIIATYFPTWSYTYGYLLCIAFDPWDIDMVSKGGLLYVTLWRVCYTSPWKGLKMIVCFTFFCWCLRGTFIAKPDQYYYCF